MDKSIYIAVTPEDVGKTLLKAFGEVILAERLSGELIPRDFVSADVGRRIYLLPPHQLAFESAEQQRWREAFFTINYVCNLLGCTVWGRSPSGPFAIADPYQGNASPWCESLTQLEEYCHVNLDYFRRRITIQ